MIILDLCFLEEVYGAEFITIILKRLQLASLLLSLMLHLEYAWPYLVRSE
jgi:hypothetical protein